MDDGRMGLYHVTQKPCGGAAGVEFRHGPIALNNGPDRFPPAITFAAMKRRMALPTALCLWLLPLISYGQGTGAKGSWFGYWGYNRSGYGTSDIHLTGPDYDLTFRKVRAQDRPSPLSKEYVGITTFTFPQYNYRVGHFFRDACSVSVGMDHMKYVVQQGQTVRMDGTVAAGRSDAYAQHQASRTVQLGPDVLQYEHTDGLNLVSVDVDHYHRLWRSSNGRNGLHLFEGLHAGVVIPRSDVRVFGEGINNNFHLSGFGMGAQAGLHLLLCKHLLVRFTGRAGWMNLPDVLTTGLSGHRASQHFWFWEGSTAVGVQFGLGRKRGAE